MEFIHVAPFAKLTTHSRFLITLRSSAGQYHQLILFRLSSGKETQIYDDPQSGDADHASQSTPGQSRAPNPETAQIFAMEAACPHLGADLSHADIEECAESDSGLIAVCPWHRYDFDLRTGKSETGLRACTYEVEVRAEDTQSVVYVESPQGGTDWRLVELRPVSEGERNPGSYTVLILAAEFADPPPKRVELRAPQETSQVPANEEPTVPTDNAPRTLMEWAVLILNTPNPKLKVLRTREAVHRFRTAQLSSIGHRSNSVPKPPDVPPREPQYEANQVDRNMIKAKRNRVGVLHALANIEQWAIDLSWDIMARFGPMHHELPPSFFSDFSKMALDESKHFSLLNSRLAELSPSTPYPFLPIHAALWESASTTADSLLSRLAIIHLVHEARGLDVNPRTIERFRKAGDHESVAVMEIIHADEVTHVTAGHRWFTWLCAREGIDPVQRFREEVKKGWAGEVKGPFNVEDRERAGMSPDFYENLRGEMPGGERWSKGASKDIAGDDKAKAQIHVKLD